MKVRIISMIVVSIICHLIISPGNCHMDTEPTCQIWAALTRGESVYSDYSPDFWQCAKQGCDACQILQEGIAHYAKQNDVLMEWKTIRVISVQEVGCVVLRVWLLPKEGMVRSTLTLSFYSPRGIIGRILQIVEGSTD